MDSEPNYNKIHHNLCCILFPANVKNDDKALQCLGGIRTISQVYLQSNKKRLGMSFQPDNQCIKKMYADSKPTSGVLLKIKIKKDKSENGVKREVLSTTVLGTVNKMFKFDSMCDFQYLPVLPNAPGSKEFKCVLEEVLPNGVDDVQTLMQPAPLHILPSNFTRSDKPLNYYYTERRYGNIKIEPRIKEEDTHKMRNDRSVPVARYVFNLVDVMPNKAHQYYIQLQKARQAMYPQLVQEYEVVKKLFEDRPIWSMNHIRYLTKIRSISLKLILPCLALYMREGPWRMLWVRYGYDPRKDPESRKYQTLDFRLRHAAGVRSMVMARDGCVHVKKTDRIRTFKRPNTDDLAPDHAVSEGAIYFRPGLTPTQRQIYYQYCDVQLEEVQQALEAAADTCHPKDGWLAPLTDQLCRDLVFRYSKQTLLASHNADLKLEQVSSEDDLSSDEDASGHVTEVTEEPSTSRMSS